MKRVVDEKRRQEAKDCVLVCILIGWPLLAFLAGLVAPVLVFFFAYSDHDRALSVGGFAMTILAAFLLSAPPVILCSLAVGAFVFLWGQPKFWVTLAFVDAIVVFVLVVFLVQPHWGDLEEFGSNFYFERSVAIASVATVVVSIVTAVCWRVADKLVFKGSR